MFIKNSERKGTCYFEFQFCKIKNPLHDGKTKDNVEFWMSDSLLLSDDDFDVFYDKYGEYFECAVFPNGKTGFDYCGINYYSPEKTLEIYNALRSCIDKENGEFIDWLKTDLDLYNGFYILGL